MTVAQSGRSDVGTPGFGLPNDCSTPPKSQVLLTSLGDWLDRPLSGWSCTLGWCVATSIFVGIVVVLGGPALNDTFESVYSTWAISHGQLACAFPADFRDIPPVYPLLSGGLSALNHVGNNVPFPPRAALGPHCDRSFLVINTWSLRSGAIDSTIKIAYVGWLALLAGVVYFLRSVGRGRRGWEPATVVLIACIPPVWMCIAATFHPQDLIATGLALAALGSARRNHWIAAGILITLAILSRQFAILVAAPLFVLAPASRKLAYLAAAAGTAVVTVIPLLIVTSGSSAKAILYGTGTTGGIGGTVLWELHLHGGLLIVLSRLSPIGLSMAIAWWTLRRLGGRALQPLPMIAVIALSSSLRLVFEQQLFGYYFMSLAVSLVLLDVIGGHIRAALVAWIAMVSMVYAAGSISVGFLHSNGTTDAQDLIPLLGIFLAVWAGVLEVHGRGMSWKVVPWVALLVGALASWNATNPFGHMPTWLWQITLVPLGIVLAARPLLCEVDANAEGTVRRQVQPSMT